MYFASQPRTGQVLTRIVLPLLLFLVVVGGIAWVTQNMPSNVRPGDDTKKPSATAKPLVEYDLERAGYDPNSADTTTVFAKWDPQDSRYIQEFERETEGHFDFPFGNVTSEPLEAGLLYSNCDCSRVDLCLLTPEEWQQLKSAQKESKGADPLKGKSWISLKKDDAGITIPPHGHGVARVVFKSKQPEGQVPTIHFKLWFQPKGQPGLRQIRNAVTPLKVVAPLIFQPDFLEMGLVRGESKAEFLCWSATRDRPKVTVDPKTEPYFDYKVEELTPEEIKKQREAWQKDEKGPRTNLRAGFRVIVTVHEEKDGKWLPQGYFRHPLALLIDGQTLTTPMLQGVVKGDVDVGGPSDQGKINLRNFPQSQRMVKEIVISTDPKDVLSLHGEPTPGFLKVNLEKNVAESTGARARWNLRVEVPEKSFQGEFPQDSVIVLRLKSTKDRLVRIPVLGNAE